MRTAPSLLAAALPFLAVFAAASQVDVNVGAAQATPGSSAGAAVTNSGAGATGVSPAVTPLNSAPGLSAAPGAFSAPGAVVPSGAVPAAVTPA
ncbi:MAG: hypothetical protein HY079_05125, partial [Elusimicrobia bacterium]|nr:hypothetical protein [Elusimicrobiota bacterium]